MPLIGDRFYANPAYGRALEQAREADASSASHPGAQDAADRGELKHVEVHPSLDGGYHVHAHYRHPQHGHHVVHAHHADHHAAAEAVHHILRAHHAAHCA